MKLTLREQLKRAQNDARGYEANWRLALKERDDARELAKSGAVYIDKVLGQCNRLALELRGVLESNQLLRDARLTGKHKSVIEMRTGGLAYAEQQAREALAAL